MDPVSMAKTALGILQEMKKQIDDCKTAVQEASSLEVLVDRLSVTIMMIPNRSAGPEQKEDDGAEKDRKVEKKPVGADKERVAGGVALHAAAGAVAVAAGTKAVGGKVKADVAGKVAEKAAGALLDAAESEVDDLKERADDLQEKFEAVSDEITEFIPDSVQGAVSTVADQAGSAVAAAASALGKGGAVGNTLKAVGAVAGAVLGPLFLVQGVMSLMDDSDDDDDGGKKKGEPSQSEVLQKMKVAKDKNGYRLFTDLDVMFCGMAFIITSALSVTKKAIETISAMRSYGKPNCMWMIMPWKTQAVLALRDNLTGHRADLESATASLQAAIGVASYAVQLEQLERALDATASLVHRDMKALWRKKIGVDKMKCEILEFSEAILSHLEEDIKKSRLERGQHVAQYTESIEHARVDPEVGLNRFISEVYNPNNDNFVSVFEVTQALAKANIKDTELAVQKTLRHLMDREGKFLSALRFYLDLRELNTDGSSVISDNWQTRLTSSGKVQDASTWDAIIADNMIDVLPFQRVVVLADIPLMDQDYFEYDNLCLLEFTRNPEDVIKANDVWNEKNTKKKNLPFRPPEFTFTVDENSRLYLKQGVNAHLFGNSDRAWNTKKFFKVGTKLKPNGESFFPEFRLLNDSGDQTSLKFTTNVNFEIIESDGEDFDSGVTVFGEVDRFKKMRVLYTPFAMTPDSIYSPRLCLTSFQSSDSESASLHRLFLAPKTYYGALHQGAITQEFDGTFVSNDKKKLCLYPLGPTIRVRNVTTLVWAEKFSNVPANAITPAVDSTGDANKKSDDDADKLENAWQPMSSPLFPYGPVSKLTLRAPRVVGVYVNVADYVPPEKKKQPRESVTDASKSKDDKNAAAAQKPAGTDDKKPEGGADAGTAGTAGAGTADASADPAKKGTDQPAKTDDTKKDGDKKDDGKTKAATADDPKKSATAAAATAATAAVTKDDEIILNTPTEIGIFEATVVYEKKTKAEKIVSKSLLHKIPIRKKDPLHLIDLNDPKVTKGIFSKSYGMATYFIVGFIKPTRKDGTTAAVKPEDVQLLHHTPKVYLVIDPRYEDPVDSAFDEESENAQMVQYAHDEDVDESAYEEANAPYCLKGHKMMSSAYSKGSYKGGYCCDSCRYPKEITTNRWFCIHCSSDLCRYPEECPRFNSTPSIYQETSIFCGGGKLGKIEVGSKVEVAHQSRATWYPKATGWKSGKVTKANGDGTFEVTYDDKTVDAKVDEANVRLKDRSAGASSSSTVNRAGVAITLGSGASANLYYCGRVLGTDVIPYSDGQCGPHNGPQCPDCDGITKTQIRQPDGTTEHQMVVSDCDFGSYESGWTCNLCKLSSVRKKRNVNYRWLCLQCKVNICFNCRPLPVTGTLQEGASVLANNQEQGFWYPAKLGKAASDGTYSVIYDDGEKVEEGDRLETSVSTTRIRLMGIYPRPGTVTFSENQDIEVNWQEVWYPCTITRVRADGTFDVRFNDDGTSESRVQEKVLRLPEGIDETAIVTESNMFCKNGHQMIRSFYHKGVYETGYVCDVCNEEKKSLRWFCIHCSNDVCANSSCTSRWTCKPSLNLKNVPLCGTKGHKMTLSSYNKGVLHNGWACSNPHCKRSVSTIGCNYEPNYRWICLDCQVCYCLGCRPIPVTGRIKEGSVVVANRDDNDIWYIATVKSRSSDGKSYDVLFDAGEGSEDERTSTVPDKRVRLLFVPDSVAAEYDPAKDLNKLLVGTKVRGNWVGGAPGEYGEIVRVHCDGTYDVRYSDGDIESYIPAKLFRVEVVANFNGRGYWYPGVITHDNGDGTFNVRYQFEDTEYSVPAERIRLLQNEDDRNLNQNLLQVGRTVEAFYSDYGSWYQARITELNADGTIDLSFDYLGISDIVYETKSVRLVPVPEVDDFVDTTQFDGPHCIQGHEMSLSSYSQCSYADAGNKYVCGICREIKPTANKRWFCIHCYYDVCEDCRDDCDHAPSPLNNKSPDKKSVLSAFNKGAYSSGFSCDDCKNTYTGYRWLYLPEQSDFCLNCKPLPEDEPGSIKVGATVLVNKDNKGSWVPAKISVVGDNNTCSVLYDDGSSDDERRETNVWNDRIRVVNFNYDVPEAHLQPVDGTQVQVASYGTWKEAVVVRSRADSSIDVTLADGTSLTQVSSWLYRLKVEAIYNGPKWLVLESKHPYDDNMNEFRTIEVEGATSYVVTFDSGTCTESGCDYVTFYKNSDHNEYWGDVQQYSGGKNGSQKVFPGLDGTAALEIPAGSFVFYFHSDGSVNDWGYKMIVKPVQDTVASTAYVSPRVASESWYAPATLVQRHRNGSYKVIYADGTENILADGTQVRLPLRAEVDETATQAFNAPYCALGHRMMQSSFTRCGYEDGFTCDVCWQTKPIQPRWLCLHCSFDVCIDCPPPSNVRSPLLSSAPKCAADHPMILSDFCKGSYAEKGWVCAHKDSCQSPSNESKYRWVCLTCRYDVCLNCAPLPPCTDKLNENSSVLVNKGEQGSWCPAIIEKRVADDVYDVIYDDGDDDAARKVASISLKNIRPLSIAPRNRRAEGFLPSLGKSVRAFVSNKWDKGNVSRIRSDGSYDISFEGDRVERKVPLKFIRVSVEARVQGEKWVIFESNHPYENNSDVYTPVRIPGTVSYTVTFDDQSKTESGCDYVTLYKDDSHNEYWGEVQQLTGGHNGSDRNFPGTDGRPPLEIPADNFVIYFHSDGSVNNWGYKMIVKPVKKARSAAADSYWYAPAQLTRCRPDGSFDVLLADGTELQNLLATQIRLPLRPEIDESAIFEPDAPLCPLGHQMAKSTLDRCGYEAGFCCDVCWTLKADQRWLCLYCSYDVCLECPRPSFECNPSFSKGPTCKSGHNMVLTNFSLGSYEKGWNCESETCKLSREPQDKESYRWTCLECRFDYCLCCQPIQEDSGASYEIGSIVLANKGNKGLWYPARVVRKTLLKTVEKQSKAKKGKAKGGDAGSPSYSLDIQYDDDEGSEEKGVEPSTVRMLQNASSAQKAAFVPQEGSRVKACTSIPMINWLEGIITRERFDGSYDVKFTDGTEARRLRSKMVRLMVEVGMSGEKWVVLESEHPYPDTADDYKTIEVPNAQSYRVVFDSQSCTEANYDYLRFYKDDQHEDCWATEDGQTQFSGGRYGSEKIFPGIGKIPPLIIPASKFIVYFHADGSNNDWGYKLIINPIMADVPATPRSGREWYAPAMITKQRRNGTYDVVLIDGSEKNVATTQLRLPLRPEVDETAQYDLPSAPYCICGHRTVLSSFDKCGYDNDYTCDVCWQAKPIQPRWLCMHCSYDVCLECPPPANVPSPYLPIAPKCTAGHSMVLSNFRKGSYVDKGWVCASKEVCESTASNEGGYRWVCLACRYDVCLSCSPIPEAEGTLPDDLPILVDKDGDGTWAPARIISKSEDATYDIIFDDGDTLDDRVEYDCAAESIRPRGSIDLAKIPSTKFLHEGNKVRAFLGKDWVQCVIARARSDGTYDLANANNETLKTRVSYKFIRPMIEVKMTGARWLILESKHPYDNSMDEYTPVTIPGAIGYTVTFDEQTMTEASCDYIYFYKDDSHSEYWGEQYSGGLNGTSKNWPGFGERSPLEIPAGNFVVYFHSDGSVNSWGYKMIIKPTNDIPTSSTDAWYAPASITQILPNGTFNVNVIDGSTRSAVPADEIRLPTRPEVDDTAEIVPDAPLCEIGHTLVKSSFSRCGYEEGYCCDVCWKRKTGQRWLCLHCSYDVCFECKVPERKPNPAIAGAPKCSNGHDMALTSFQKGSYENGWICDNDECTCSSFNLNLSTNYRWCCLLCKEDYCLNCKYKLPPMVRDVHVGSVILVNYNAEGFWYPAKTVRYDESTGKYEISFDDHDIDKSALTFRVPIDQVYLLKEGKVPTAGPMSLRRGLRVAIRYDLRDSEWHTGMVLRRLAGGSTFDWEGDDGKIAKAQHEKLTRVLVEARTSDGLWVPARVTRILGNDKYCIAYDSDPSTEIADVPEDILRLSPLDETAISEPGYAPFCKKGHEMVRSTLPRFGYENGFWCDECREHFDRSCERWFCIHCDSDLCYECPMFMNSPSPYSSVAPLCGAEGHRMVLTDVMKGFYEGGWSCNKPDCKDFTTIGKHCTRNYRWACMKCSINFCLTCEPLPELKYSMIPGSQGQRIVIESPHPYNDGTDEYRTISVPGATSYTITFDPESNTERGCDYIYFYKNDNHDEFWGEAYSGGHNGSDKTFPGVDGTPALEIPAESFVFYFHSDYSVNDWGYKIVIRANVDSVPIQKGSAVLVNEDNLGVWYPASVTDYNSENNTFAIAFDDGARNEGKRCEDGVPAAQVRLHGIKLDEEPQKRATLDLDILKKVKVYVAKSDSWEDGLITFIRSDDFYEVTLRSGGVLVSVPAKLIRLKVDYEHAYLGWTPAVISKAWLDGTYNVITDSDSELVEFVEEGSVRLPVVHIDIPYEVDDTVEEEPSDASPVYCKRGHRMALSAFNKGGYGGEAEFGCDLCGQLKSGRRHFCILCTSDLCLDCNAWGYKASPYEYFAPDCPVVWQTQTDVRSVCEAREANVCTVEAVGLDLGEAKLAYVRFTARSDGSAGGISVPHDGILVVNETVLTVPSHSHVRVEKYDPQSEIKATVAFDISSVIELFKASDDELTVKFSYNKLLGYSLVELELPEESTISWQTQKGAVGIHKQNPAYVCTVVRFGLDVEEEKAVVDFFVVGDGTAGDLALVADEAKLTVGASVLTPDVNVAPSISIDEPSVRLAGTLTYDISTVVDAFADANNNPRNPFVQFTFNDSYSAAALQVAPHRDVSLVNTQAHKMKLSQYLEGVYEAADSWCCNTCQSQGDGFRWLCVTCGGGQDICLNCAPLPYKGFVSTGSTVEVRSTATGSAWSKGRITAVNNNDTYDVICDDGTNLTSVPAADLHLYEV